MAALAAGPAAAARPNRAVLAAGPCVPSDQRVISYGWSDLRGVTRLSLYSDTGRGLLEYERFVYSVRQPAFLTMEHTYNTTQASTFLVEVYVRGKLAHTAGPLTPPVQSC